MRICGQQTDNQFCLEGGLFVDGSCLVSWAAGPERPGKGDTQQTHDALLSPFLSFIGHVTSSYTENCMGFSVCFKGAVAS